MNSSLNSLAIQEQLEAEAPAPLSPLNDYIASPDNIALEMRRQAAETMTWWQRWKAQQTIKGLTRRLSRSGFDDLLPIWHQARDEMQSLKDEWDTLQKELSQRPDDPVLLKTRDILEDRRQALEPRYRNLQQQLKPMAALAQQRRDLQQRLENHAYAMERLKAEQQLFKDLQKEAQTYKEIIQHRLTRLKLAYWYTQGGREVVERVQFDEVQIMADAHWLHISGAYRTALGAWKTDLPIGVKVADIIDEATLWELSIACGRHVRSWDSPQSGAWLIVDRLNAVDGLMSKVLYNDVMSRYPKFVHDRIPIPAGVGLNRRLEWVPLADFPHWLIAGFTGAGKSNMLNVALATIITMHNPRDIRLFMIDLKGGLEFGPYSGIPHLHGNIIKDVPGVVLALAELQAILEDRLTALEGKARKLEDYNRLPGVNKLPRLLCVFDEVASIEGHGADTKRIKASLADLTRRGRAVGIHIWLCTQRPDVSVIEGQIKANTSVRFVGQMRTASDSITVIGKGSAAKMEAIPGRMMLSYGPEPKPVQTPYIDDNVILDAIAEAMKYPAPPPLSIPQLSIRVHQSWTPERVIALSIDHLDGNIGWTQIWNAASDEDLSKRQAQELVEKVWNMPHIEYKGQRYELKRGKGHKKQLVPVSDAEILSLPASDAGISEETLPETQERILTNA